MPVTSALIRSLRHANTWLQPCPTENLGLRLITAEYTMLSKIHLGEAIVSTDSEVVCGACGEPADVYGDHFLCCRKGGLVQRHTAIASQLWRICTVAGIQARPEVSLENRARPADLLLSHWQGGGPCAIGVAVVHPLAPSAPGSGVKDGSEAIAAIERVKFVKYADACPESNIRFIPLVLSTFGKLGGEGDRFYQHLASLPTPRPRLRQQYSPRNNVDATTPGAIARREVARMLLQGRAGYSSTLPSTILNDMGINQRQHQPSLSEEDDDNLFDFPPEASQPDSTMKAQNNSSSLTTTTAAAANQNPLKHMIYVRHVASGQSNPVRSTPGDTLSATFSAECSTSTLLLHSLLRNAANSARHFIG